MRSACNTLTGTPEAKRPFGMPGRRWETSIETDLQETGCGDVGWIYLAQDTIQWRALLKM
jgi:hypothetical protein